MGAGGGREWEQRGELYFLLTKGLPSKKTLVLHQWESDTRKFGIKHVNKGEEPTSRSMQLHYIPVTAFS